MKGETWGGALVSGGWGWGWWVMVESLGWGVCGWGRVGEVQVG